MRKPINRKKRSGKGIVNSLIDKLPFELHLPKVSVYVGERKKNNKS